MSGTTEQMFVMVAMLVMVAMIVTSCVLPVVRIVSTDVFYMKRASVVL